MGVLGLWQLLQSTGRLVPLESLENKTLAVDVSMWMHQAVRGVRDRRGIAVTDAHLLVLFNRICKLLHYRIKPVFVFDGPAPVVKQRLLERRRNARASAQSRAEKLSRKWLENVVQQQAVNEALRTNGKSPVKVRKPSPSKPPGKSPRRGRKNDEEANELIENLLEAEQDPSSDMYALPPMPDEEPSSADFDTSTDEDSSSDEADNLPSTGINPERFDIESEDFKALPPEIRYEILVDLQASRRRPSWKNAKQLPAESDKFSKFQINRLLTRCQVQVELDKTSRELNSHRTGQICDKIGDGLSDGTACKVIAQRIVSEDSAHYLLVKRQPSATIQRSISSGSQNSSESFTVVDEKMTEESNNDISLLPESVRKILEKSIVPKEAPTLPDLFLEEMDGDEDVQITGQFGPTENTVRVHTFANERTVNKKSRSVVVSKIVAPTEITDGKQPMEVIDIEADSADDIVVIESADDIPKKNMQSAKPILLDDDKPKLSPPVTAEIKKSESEKQRSDALIASIASDNSDSDGDFVEISPVKETDLGKSREMEPNQPMTDDLVQYYSQADFSDFFDSIPRTPSPQPSTSQAIPISPVNIPSPSQLVKQPPIFHKEDEDAEAVHAFLSVPEFDLRKPAKSVEVVDLEDDAQFDMAELSVEELQGLQEHLASEGKQLRMEQKKEERVAASVTEQLRHECQELLRLFGIPYIVSPGEAEAQCAFLDTTKQTHGTITDDSDVFLFGGQKVYRNMFHKQKNVEYYNAEDIEKQLGLEREKIIALALLTGSDYTEGIEGVGAVRALEILAEFGGKGLQSLKSFSKWVKATAERRSNGDIRPENRLRAALCQLPVPENFPDKLVVDAYLQPGVDESKEKLSWSAPALDLLRDYTRRKFGWGKQKADDVLLPIIKRLNTRTTQTHLESYFKVQLRKPAENPVSKRVGNALKKMKSSEELNIEVTQKNTKPKKGESEYFPVSTTEKRRGRPKKTGTKGKRQSDAGAESDTNEASTSTTTKASTNVKRRKTSASASRSKKA